MKKLLLTIAVSIGLTASTMAQVPNYVPTSGLIGWWPFNGNTNDESGNGNNGSILGGATLAQDRFNNLNTAYEIDGINCPNAKGISLPSNINNTGAYSISIWFQTMDSTKTDQNIFNSFPHQYIGVNFNYPYTGFENKTCSFLGNGTWQVNGSTINWNTYNLSDWHNIIVVKNTSSISYYQDGVLKFSLPMQPSYNSGAFTSIVIGAISINGGSQCYETFKGKLDDVAIWNRDLTQQEITDLYNGCQLSVSTQPASQNININNNLQLIVGSSDLNATYQWQTDLGVGFQNLNSVGQYSGTTNDTLIISNVTMSNNNQPFRCIVSSGSCSDTSNVAVLSVNSNVGINEKSQDKLFTVFPNPAQSVINIKADSKLIGSFYSIYDNTGRVVLSGKLNAENTTIELGNLSGGIYMFSVGENMKQTFKIIKAE